MQQVLGRDRAQQLSIAQDGLAAVLTQNGTDRYDVPTQPMGIHAVRVGRDERDYGRCGRSISAAKKAEAAFKIEFARRNSAFSRRSLRSSSL